MFRRTCLLASGLLLLYAPVTTPQEPKDAQAALTEIARLEGRVKFDAQRKVVVEIDL